MNTSYPIRSSPLHLRIAVSNGRLLSMDEVRVRLRHKVMTLAEEELVRRYLLHVLPKGLMRIRHFDFLSNRHRRCKLTQIRTALSKPPDPEVEPTERSEALAAQDEPERCPRCRIGRLRVTRELPGTVYRWRTSG